MVKETNKKEIHVAASIYFHYKLLLSLILYLTADILLTIKSKTEKQRCLFLAGNSKIIALFPCSQLAG